MKPGSWKVRAFDALIIVSVVSFITVLSLLTKSFWGDEILSISFSSGTVANVLSSVASDYHPPLYFLLLKLWIMFFGTGEVILRIFQGTQSVVFLWLSLIIFRNTFPSNRYHPFWILLLVSSEFWLFTPMVRYYIFAADLVLLATIVFFYWLTNSNIKTTIMLVLTYVAVLYSDYLSAIVLFVHAVIVVWKYRSLVKTLFIAYALSFLAFIPWIMTVLSQIHHLVSTHHDADLNASPFAMVIKIAFSLYAFTFGEMLYPFEPITVLGLLLFIVTIVWICMKKDFPKNENLFYAILLVTAGIVFTSFVTTYIASRTSFIYTPSRALFALPFLFLSGGMMYSSIRSRWMQFIFFGGVLAINLMGDIHWIENSHFIMPVYASPWKTVVHDLQGTKGIIISDESLCYDYYRGQSEGAFPLLLKPKTVDDLNGIVRDSSITLILVGRESTESEVHQEIIDFLNANAKLTGTKKYLPIDKEYQELKSTILHRPSYDAKITVFHYEL